MGFKVAKFGGSSLADANQFRKVKAIMDADPARKYLVPSAPGKRSYTDEKITDMLYTCAARAEQKQPFGDVFDRIIERYVDIAFELSLKIDILSHLQKVRTDIENGAGPDYAASRGEYLNALLLSEFLGFEFLDAAEVICFDEDGRFNAEKTHAVISERIKNMNKVVMPGFYGAYPDGRIKTFSRGGSDISGAILARGAAVDVYENWTDVSGFLMADPRIVKDPKPIDVVSYSELRELAYMGATVLHEDAIFPVRQACIPINVKNTNAPEHPGTMIVPDGNRHTSNNIVTGIAGHKGFTVIALAKDNMNGELGFGRKVLQVLEEFGISFEHMPSGIDTLSVVIADKELEGKRKKVVDELIRVCNADSVEIHDNMALIATVGRGMVSNIGTAATLFSALAREKVNIRMIDQGSSELNIIVGVESDDFHKAMNAIYDAFVDMN
ncbi:MAG: aspartate kinase [Clostridia bacterium]|nr:aspartate kinase [Clostridia bacterium]MBR0026443.1 aspartate kinase [Clostridia bacterium]